MDIKRNLLVIPAILLISCPLTAFAETKCAEVSGNMIVGKVTLGCTNIQGSATFKTSTFTGKLDVAGPLKANASNLAEVDVAGDVTLDNSVVSGTAKITGDIIATDTTFKATLQAFTHSITLIGSTAEDIEITPSKPHEAAYLYLNAGSTVNGNITFKNGHGIVKNNHSTLKGKVTGGKIE
jgi:hypothetical protein